MDSNNDFTRQGQIVTQKRINIFKLHKRPEFLATVFITALVVGTGGYWLGAESRQSPSSSWPTYSPTQTLTIIHKSPTIQLTHPGTQVQNAGQSNPEQNTESDKVNWRTYRSEFGYRYSYPPAWYHSVGDNSPISFVSAPGVKYPDSTFEVERKHVSECKDYQKFLLELNPNMKQKKVEINGYPAFQLEGRSTLGDGYTYNRKSVLLSDNDTCYYIDITSRINSEHWDTLNRILSTFALLVN